MAIDETHSNERLLLQCIAQGDEIAFKQLFDKYWENIYAVAYVMTRSRETSRDIVQEVFLKIWLLRDELPAKSNFRDFLFIVARNYIFSEFRKRRKHQPFVDHLTAYFDERYQSADHLLLFKESAALIQKAIDRLSPQQREVYILSREKGWTHDEISDHLGISKTTIKTHMSRALAAIRVYLEDNAISLLLLMPVIHPVFNKYF